MPAFFCCRKSTAGRRLLFTFFLAAVFLLIYVGVSRTIIRPLEKSKKGSGGLRRGTSTGRSVSGTPQSELGALSSRLNQMAEAIQDKLQKLSNSLAESQALLGGMEEGVLILDLQGRVKKMNDSMLAILPQSFPADLGKHYLEVFRDPGAQRSDPNDPGLGTGIRKEPFPFSASPIKSTRCRAP